MRKTKQFSTVGYIAALAVVVLALGSVAMGYVGDAPKVVVEGDFIEAASGVLGGAVHNIVEEFSEGITVDGTTVIDGDGNWDGAITGTTGSFSSTLGVTGALTAANVTVSGQLKNTPGAITATTTLTTSSGNIQFLDTSAVQTTITLPTKTATGTMFQFIVRGALTGVTYQITSAEKDNISGSLIVAGAVVDCRDEDYINIITDGEAIGDQVQLISLGTSGWAILDSGVLTTGKMTCTDPS